MPEALSEFLRGSGIMIASAVTRAKEVMLTFVIHDIEIDSFSINRKREQ